MKNIAKLRIIDFVKSHYSVKMGECYWCCGYPNILCNGECREPDYSELEEKFAFAQLNEEGKDE